MAQGRINIAMVGNVTEEVAERLREWNGSSPLVLTTEHEISAAKLDHIDVLVFWWPSATLVKLSLEKAKSLKYVHFMNDGLDGIPLELLAQRNIPVSNGRGIASCAIAEFAIACVLAHFKRLPNFFRQTQASIWGLQHCKRIEGKLLAVLGLGSIGREVARLGKALGMQVWGVKRTIDAQPIPYVDKVYDNGSLHEVMSHADAVIVALPLTKRTYRMIGATEFSLMKEDSVLVNVSRGAIIDEQALCDGLILGRPAAAYLDATEQEPLPAESRLWSNPNVVITSHSSWSGEDFIDNCTNNLIKNLETWLKIGKPWTSVDLTEGY
jgi:D-2-hydroxyacid dehydrogenase (NADP+)